MGTEITIVETQAKNVDRLVFIDTRGGVWLTFSRPWWDLASWLWWFLSNGAKKWLQVTRGKKIIRVRAVQLAKEHVIMGQTKKQQ